MTIEIVPADVIRGAAVVVDDRIENPEENGNLQSILDQLRDAQVPTILLKELPSIESIVHWKQFGLIVLDWELSFSGDDDDEDEIEMGISIPTELADSQREKVIEFIGALLTETALPIFIASNADLHLIEASLADSLGTLDAIRKQRLRIYSKKDLKVSLFAQVEEWMQSRPSLMALRAWNRAYVDAEIETFHHLMEAEDDWVAAIHRAAINDKAEVGGALKDMLARNVVNRLNALDLTLAEPSAEMMVDASSLRHAMYLSAVVPEAALTSADLTTGDLFVADAASEPYDEIRVLLTPECDLLRKETPRFTYVVAKPNYSNQGKTSKNRSAAVRNPTRGNLPISVLTAGGLEYNIPLKEWESIWVSINTGAGQDDFDANCAWPGFRRVGRLLDPYITHIQQSFAFEVTRRGLPRLPDDFFEGMAQMDAPAQAVKPEESDC